MMRFCLNAKQKGAALIFATFVIGLAVTAYLLKVHSLFQTQAQQNQTTMQALNDAKYALIAWAVSHPDHPGQMPFPDRGTGGGYDGNSDCIPSNYVDMVTLVYGYNVLLGQLPLYGQTAPCVSPQTGIGVEAKDAYGNNLWYAVSRNLVHKYETYPVEKDAGGNVINDYPINPDVINTPKYPWLRVVDANGNLLSDRVAAVVIAPHQPLGAQNRAGIADPSQFLDSFTSGGTLYSNANYLVPNQVFVMGQDSKTVSSTDPRFVQPYYFNDKLVYITIDELIAALNRRAASEAGRYLNQYQAKAGQFPNAAPLGSVNGGHIAVSLSQKGFVPVDVTDTCACSSSSKCTCSFGAISQVSLTRDNGTWASSAGACTISQSNKNCDCTGAGSCVRSGTQFTCDAAGVCEHNLAGINPYTYTVPSYAKINPPNGVNCTNPVGKQIQCWEVEQFSIGLDMPAWFNESAWANYLYYEWSGANNLQSGGRGGIAALLVATGTSLTSELGIVQTRPSSNITNYLDSAENTNNDTSYDAMIKPSSNSYNDQPFVVAP